MSSKQQNGLRLLILQEIAIVSDAIGLLVTLSDSFDFHVAGTALLLPHRNTIWAP